MTPGILEHQGLTGGNDLTAEGERDGCNTVGGVRLGKTDRAFEELVVVGNEGYERDGGAQQPRGHPGKTVKTLLGRGVEEGRAPERGQSVGAGQQTLCHM